MLFNSIDFLIFFVVVYALYTLFSFRFQNWLLLSASLFFYGCWDYRFLGLIMVSMVTDFVAGRNIGGSDDPLIRKRWLYFSLSVDLGILGFFKYYNFFVDSAAAALGAFGLAHYVARLHLDIILPVGISFYTFQAMSYTIDVYRGTLKPTNSFPSFALFVTFFPQLVAGPIERASHLLPQVLNPRRIDALRVREGLWLILHGLFIKMVIADNLAVMVDRYFENQTGAGWGFGLVALYAFSIQILCDFAGYSDIACGTARLLGFDLMMNFRNPYFATDPSDFWRRWHISLSTWLRDYLYIPLGGNRRGAMRAKLNLVITMLLGGLWHGASWTFVIWGLFHGLLLVAYKIFDRSSTGARKTSGIGRLLKMLLMYHLVCIGWLFFRAGDFSEVVTFCRSFSGESGWGHALANDTVALLLLASPLLALQYYTERHQDPFAVLRLSIVPRSIVYAFLILAIISLGRTGGNAFIYFQF